MEQSPCWEANWFSASQEIPCILWNLKVHYRINKCPSPVPILQSGKNIRHFIWRCEYVLLLLVILNLLEWCHYMLWGLLKGYKHYTNVLQCYIIHTLSFLFPCGSTSFISCVSPKCRSPSSNQTFPYEIISRHMTQLLSWIINSSSFIYCFYVLAKNVGCSHKLFLQCLPQIIVSPDQICRSMCPQSASYQPFVEYLF